MCRANRTNHVTLKLCFLQTSAALANGFAGASRLHNAAHYIVACTLVSAFGWNGLDGPVSRNVTDKYSNTTAPATEFQEPHSAACLEREQQFMVTHTGGVCTVRH